VLASGAIWGPAVFIAAWVVAGRLLAGYDPIDDQISRLAALGASTRVLMNLGFIASTIGAITAAWGLRSTIGPPAAMALALNGIATFGVLLHPLGGPFETEFLHAMFALLAYLTLSAIGPLSARVLARRSRLEAVLAVTVGVVSLVTLTLSLGDTATGLFQRIGLTTTGIWLMGVGAVALIGRSAPR
jgi:hypothetical membrane protein